MGAKKKVFYAIYGPQFQGVVRTHGDYKTKVNGMKKTFGKKCDDEQTALAWIENKKKSLKSGKNSSEQTYYAIFRPDEQLIVHSLKQFKKETQGYAHAHGKKFKTESEAVQWLSEKMKSITSTQMEQIEVKSNVRHVVPEQQAIIYIDGSFKDGVGKYGFVVFSSKSTTRLYQDFGFVYDQAFNELMNVGAEMMACLRALEWAYSNNMKDIHLIYDYEGVITHCKSNTTNSAICLYQKMMQAFHKHIQIHFLHVRHANREYHNLAHKLTQLSV